MISLAGRDILHAWGKFVFTGVGLGLLIGVTLTMAGVYRGMVDDAKVLLDNSGADLWVVQKDTQGPYAEASSLPDDSYRSIQGMPGVAHVANVTYLTMQVRALDKAKPRDVLRGRQACDEVVPLEDEAEVRDAKCREFTLLAARDTGAEEIDVAARGREHAADDREEGRLAASRAATSAAPDPLKSSLFSK